jgi:ParB family chromosome partitioning protein
MSGILEHLDPTTVLVIGDNVRDNVRLEPQFVASITGQGVLQPVTAARTPDGVEIGDGQRRTLAAREAKLPTIPVYVIEDETANANAATAERIALQIVANDHREALTDAQRANGINQMLLAGVTPSRVAKTLSMDRDPVTAAADVAQSATSQEAFQSGQLSLIEAAALREFEDDEHAIAALKAVAGTASFDHPNAWR